MLYGCFKRNADAEVKVVQLAGYIAEKTCYHHGEASLYATIVNMAQDFVGSNNVPLLAAAGQFGTRAQVRNDTIQYSTVPYGTVKKLAWYSVIYFTELYFVLS